MALNKLIGIWSVSLSGSTLCEFMLGSLEGVAAVGEVSRLSDSPERTCSVCERGTCPYFTPEFQKSVTDENLYERVAEQLEVETLVVSDKLPSVYRRLFRARKRDMLAVLLFKDPLSFVSSYMKWGQFKGLSLDIEHSLKMWLSIYNQIFDALSELGISFITVSYADLAMDPKGQLKRMCDFLVLPYNPEAVNYWNYQHHHLSGNTATHINIWGLDSPRSQRYLTEASPERKFYIDNFRTIVPDERWRTYLSTKDIMEICTCREAWEMQEKLEGLKNG